MGGTGLGPIMVRVPESVRIGSDAHSTNDIQIARAHISRVNVSTIVPYSANIGQSVDG